MPLSSSNRFITGINPFTRGSKTIHGSVAALTRVALRPVKQAALTLRARGGWGLRALGEKVNKDMKIKLYAVSTCVHCDTLKNMLSEGKFTYESVDVDLLKGKQRREMIEEVREKNKRCSFPTLVVGERVIVGFKEDEIRQALGI